MDLLANYSTNSYYTTYTGASIKSDGASSISGISAQSIQQASFSLDASFEEAKSPSIVSIPVEGGEGIVEHLMDVLAEKLKGFLEPFGHKGEELESTIGNAIESLAGLLQYTSDDATAISLEINLIEMEKTVKDMSTGTTATIRDFGFEVYMETTTPIYDPETSAVIGMDGSRVGFGTYSMLQGHLSGVFNEGELEVPTLEDLKKTLSEHSYRAKEIVNFLKNTQKAIEVFTPDEESRFRLTVADLLKDHSILNINI